MWVNIEMCGLLGYERNELVGRSFTEFTHPDDIDLDVEFSTKAFAGEIPYFRERKRYLRKNGSVMVGDLLASISFDEDGKPDGGSAVLVDAGNADPVSHSQEIVSRNGGRILVDSTPGEGSVFTIRLPQSPADN